MPIPQRPRHHMRVPHLHQQCAPSARLALQLLPCSVLKKEKNTHYIFSSQRRTDQMLGPPWEGQLMFTLLLSMRQSTEQYYNDNT